MNRLLLIIPLLLTLFFVSTFFHNISLAEFPSTTDAPVELGQVGWIRDFDEGVSQAKQQDKPILVLFQEVPGCSTSSGYGKNVLSHPLIVEAVETLFVPVAIYNNHTGEDETVLKSFREPSWNNPVVRIITPDREELAPRLSGDYTKAGLVRAMITALENDNKPVPKYLTLLAQELNVKSGKSEQATFAMHCFWVGEGRLAPINGVISTNPGFMGGHEVVEVIFNPDVISYEDLLKKAKSNRVASHVFTANSSQTEAAKDIVGTDTISPHGSFRPDSRPKYYMSRTLYRYVPMTNTQIAKVNAALGAQQSPDVFLSPRQLNIYRYIQEHPDNNWTDVVKNSDFNSAWNKTVSLMGEQITRR